MKRSYVMNTSCVVLAVACFGASGQEGDIARRSVNPVFAPIQDDPNLPRVLLIGDSISIGYTLPTRELLEGKANVHRIPINGGPTTRGLAEIDTWLGEKPWDVIHFNWGLHDVKFMDDGLRQVGYDAYEQNLSKLVASLKETRAKLIWASTTPVPQGNLRPLRKPGDEVAYNIVARRIMEENDVAIDDLYTHAVKRLETIQQPANVHFTQEGSHYLAEQVAATIMRVLEEK